jgi:heme/copper-type cytochrome/quinol oxidase subunit 2
LCGGGHAQMSGGMLTVESEDDYKKWLRSKSGSGAAASFE